MRRETVVLELAVAIGPVPGVGQDLEPVLDKPNPENPGAGPV